MRTGRILVLVLIATGLAIALSAISAAAETPGLEAGGEDRVQLFASVSSSADLMRSGNTVVFRVRVVDQFGAVVEGATVVDVTDPTEVVEVAAPSADVGAVVAVVSRTPAPSLGAVVVAGCAR